MQHLIKWCWRMLTFMLLVFISQITAEAPTFHSIVQTQDLDRRITADAATFDTDLTKVNLTIVQTQDQYPVIRGNRPTYKFGEMINVACSSNNTAPNSTLNWYMNGEIVHDSSYYYMDGYTKKGNDYAGSNHISGVFQLNLILQLKNHHFISDEMKLKCIETVPSVSWRSSQLTIRTCSYNKHRSSSINKRSLKDFIRSIIEIVIRYFIKGKGNYDNEDDGLLSIITFYNESC